MSESLQHVLGIDIGSVAVAVAEIDPSGNMVQHSCHFHHGQAGHALKQALKQYNAARIGGIAATVSTPANINALRRYDDQVAALTAARRYFPRARSILTIGAEKFGLIQLDRQAGYRTFRANSGCAAGTGSFLDQQALRLNLRDAAELSALALENTGDIPKIASRCAVFAKTDLIHAQQEGCRLEEICDGLCHGLAKNIVDVLFSGQKPLGPVLLTGGVARNRAVAGHIRSMIGPELIVTHYPCAAAGAALCLLNEILTAESRPVESPVTSPGISMEALVSNKKSKKKFSHDPIALKLSTFPDFTGWSACKDTRRNPANPVEVDIYEEPASFDGQNAWLGIDIGSTSSKAVLVASANRRPLAGFYTRTAGRPVEAVQSLLAAIERLLGAHGVAPAIQGVATTGSGRKFAGTIIGADLMLDEITAHAKAAVALHPQVDTIIEIGGQDAKFTTLQNGRVTFSIMNAVCAAGTGSFIEEQALKLGCPLEEIDRRTAGRRSPLASDRCTVFMERDVNHYLSEGYSVEEVLAAVLHSVVENYLNKVAIETNIGNAVVFQGATAKNKSLVAALEQRLQKPILVSRYCHLTGALGAALALAEQGTDRTCFKGMQLHRKAIPMRSEICELCANHCKLTIAEVNEEEVAYGFLCGRDYQTPKRVSRNISGFDLRAAYKKAFKSPINKPRLRGITVGLPAALHLIEDLPMWRHFFDNLGIATVTSAGRAGAEKKGKLHTGAEFCAPMTALFGHVYNLLERSDAVFLPFYLEHKPPRKNTRRQYCYYTQYAPTLVSELVQQKENLQLLTPLVHYVYNDFFVKVQLYRMLKNQLQLKISFFDVSAAYDYAVRFKHEAQNHLKALYQRHARSSSEPHVVLLGRPYTILDASMNKGIVEIFSALGVKTFYQEMLTYGPEDVEALAPLLAEVHWEHAARILEAAEATARTDSAYPVLVTAFKCTPDSFVMDYFKKVMAAHDKPFAILQLDEHDSSVGYETRIEAAVAAFREHHAAKPRKPETSACPVLPAVPAGQLAGKTLVFPKWDPSAQRLVAANLRKHGFDARLLEGSEASTRQSMRLNNGQCTPLTIIAREYMDFIQTNDLDPERTVLWLSSAKIACNIGLFPRHIHHLLQARGNGMEKAGIYIGHLSLADISMRLPLNTYLAFMFGGLLKKVACRIRPYEKTPGATDTVLEKSVSLLEDVFEYHRSKEDALERVIEWFEAVERNEDYHNRPRPKAAIFGDLYVRDNAMINQNLIHFIEAQGGEVVTTPYSSYVKMIAEPYLRKWFVEGRFLEALSSRAFIAAISRLEKVYYKYFQRILAEPEPIFDTNPQEILSTYGVRIENNGESMENILKIHYLKKHHPDLALFVQTNPAFCCPSLVTEAMAATIERITRTPVVSITYDGTGGNKNDIITPYLKFPRRSDISTRKNSREFSI